MRLTRVHVDAEPGTLRAGAETDLSAVASEHITRVLRLRVGAMLTAFDGHGGEWQAKLTSVLRNRARIECQVHQDLERESAFELTLLQSLARGDKMDWVIQKATELGVQRIIAVSAARSVVQIDDGRAATRLTHWRAVAISACEQCGRNRLPEILGPLSIAAACAAPLATPRFVLLPGATLTLRAAVAGAQAAALLIGPEGGFAAEELSAAEQSGFQAISLGPRILRTETAAIAALTALQLLRGDLGQA